MLRRPADGPGQQVPDPLLQDRIGRQADGVADPLGLQQLVQLGLGERRVAAEVEIEAALTVAGDHRLQHRPPAFRAVDVAGPQDTALQVAELVEDEQRMVTGTAEVAVPGRALLLAMGRALRDAVIGLGPDQSSRTLAREMTTMEIYAALDVSLEKTSVCILDRDGRTVLEAVVASEPEALAACLAPYRRQLVRLGLEAGPLSEWLVRGLAGHGLAAVLMETRQVRAALSAMTAKTDRGDARGMAHLLRLGWFRPVHVKTVEAREQRALLSARSVLTRRLRDIENSTRGLLRGFGLRLPRLLGSRWDGAVREMVAGHPALPAILEPLLLARAALRDQLAVLDKRVRDVARADEVCRRLMTVPGVGAVVALTFKAAVDRPERFASSKSVGACFGLTPKRYQSGEADRVGAISRAGDVSVRVALFEAAHVMLARTARWSSLKAWAVRLAQRRGQSAPRSRWPGSSAWSCTACGSMGPTSASAPNREAPPWPDPGRRPLSPDRLDQARPQGRDGRGEAAGQLGASWRRPRL